MTDERLEHIKKINAKKAYGHAESAVSHVAELIKYIEELRARCAHDRTRK